LGLHVAGDLVDAHGHRAPRRERVWTHGPVQPQLRARVRWSPVRSATTQPGSPSGSATHGATVGSRVVGGRRSPLPLVPSETCPASALARACAWRKGGRSGTALPNDTARGSTDGGGGALAAGGGRLSLRLCSGGRAWSGGAGRTAPATDPALG